MSFGKSEFSWSFNLTELRVAWVGSTGSPGGSLGVMKSEATSASTPWLLDMCIPPNWDTAIWRVVISCICCVLKDGTPAFRALPLSWSLLTLYKAISASGEASCFWVVQYVIQQWVPCCWAQCCTCLLKWVLVRCCACAGSHACG